MSRLTPISTDIGFQEVSSLSANASNRDGLPKKQTAVPAGPRNGGKTNKKTLNLQSRDYLARRLDAIAELLAPPFPCPLVIERLIELADAALPDCDLEPSFGSESFGCPGSDECEIDPDFEESLNFTDQRGNRSYANYGVWAVDLEYDGDERDYDGDEQDAWECPAHLPGGNGEWLPGGYPFPEMGRAGQ